MRALAGLFAAVILAAPNAFASELNLAPDCSAATPSTEQLWPPRHEMVPIEVLGISDPDGEPVEVAVQCIWQDEPPNFTGDGNTIPDAAGVGSSQAWVLQERSGNENGRFYHIDYIATDERGASCGGTVKVSIAKSRNRPAIDEGRLYPSAPSPHVCGPYDINNPPVIHSEPVLSGRTGEPYRYDVNAHDPDLDPLNYSLIAAPLGMSIHPETGEIAWQVGSNQHGEQAVTVSVEDGRGGRDTQQFAINVEKLNEPPTAQGQSFQTAQNIALDVRLIGADPNDDELTYLIKSGPENGTLTREGADGVYLPNPYFEGTDAFTFVVSDGEFESERATVDIEVIAQGNNPPRILSEPVTPHVLEPGSGESEVLDLSTWDLVILPNPPGTHPEPNWVFNSNKTTATQTRNAVASALLGDFEFSNSQIEGKWRVNTIGDDDFMGFVFGYQNPRQFYLFDWKRNNQSNGLRGMSLRRFDYDPSFGNLDLWSSYGPRSGEVLYRNDIPWLSNTAYDFALAFEPGKITISVKRGNQVLDSFTVYDNRFVDGRFGFYNYSQSHVQYSGFASERLANRTYWYPVEAIDPDGDAMSFRLIDGPEGMSIDPNRGIIRWETGEERVGQYPVVLEVADEHGATARQSYQLVVTDEAPVIVSTPTDVAYVDDPYRYAVTAFDPNPGDLLTYSLMAGPPGMIIDPRSGQVDWVPTAGELGEHSVTVGVSDPKGHSAQQTYRLTVREHEANANPEFTSEPITQATVGRQYSYSLSAHDPDGDQLVYGFPDSVPYHMQMFDGRTVIWTPTADQVADHTITVDVRDGRGGVAEQVFTISVRDLEGNHPPSITSEPPSAAIAGELYEYPVTASDPDGDRLSYRLDLAPGGMTIEPDSGLVRWTPTLEQVAYHRVRVVAEDADQAYAVQEYTLSVIPGDANGAPVISSTPPTQATVEAGYRYDPRATDPDGDAVSFALQTSPAEMTLDPATGAITWTPAQGDEGVHEVVLVVSDERGASATQMWSVGVGSRPNQPPSITSTPNGSVVTGDTYLYQVQAFDADGDPLRYSLVKAPSEMTIEPESGQVRWETGGVALDAHEVELRVEDGFGGSAWQRFSVVITELPNQAPSITSTPAWSVRAGQAYSYLLGAVDPDGDALQYQLLEGPDGAVLDSASGALSWSPGTEHTGPHGFAVRASDSRGGYAEQRWSVAVMDGDNRAPAIGSEPTTQAVIGEGYGYRVQASDPDGDPMRYALDVAPGGMTIDQTGLISWTPDVAQLGSHRVMLTVSDGRGGSAFQSFTIWAAEEGDNTPPVVTSAPSLLGTVKRPYRYQVLAHDAEDDPLRFRLLAAPEGMSIEPESGLLTWLPGTSGDHQVAIRVDDGQAWGEQSYVLRVGEEDVPLALDLSVEPSIVDKGEQVVVTVQTRGGIPPVVSTLFADGVEVPLDAYGRAAIVADTGGRHELYVEARDEQARVSAMDEFRVRDPDDQVPPLASIGGPVEGGQITAPVEIVGTADDANFFGYRLLYAPAGTTDYTEFAAGSQPVTDGVLGTFDPSLLHNGLYDVVLLVDDLNGQQTGAKLTYEVAGNLKVGHFSITFEDLTIPLAGLPVTVTRTYDTRDRGQALEFGHGWSIGYRSLRLQENRTPGRNWQINSYGGTFGQKCVESNGDRLVTIALPGGKLERFRAKASPECAQLAPTIDVNLVYESLDNSGAKLEQLDYGLLRLANGDLIDLSYPEGPVDPQRYRLTTAEGVVYDVDQSFGVRRITEPNGHSITFSESGIQHSAGVGMSFVRDGAGRITAIEGPDGHALGYAYNAAGELIGFTDRQGNETTYTYAAGHYLEDIVDPRGVRAVRNEYDDRGRLIAQIGPDGERIELEHDLVGRQEIVRDALGNATIYSYDERGNVLTETNALGETITRTYDDENNVLSETDGQGNTTGWTYDARGNKLSETDPLGRTTTWTYDARNQVLTQTDPDGRRVVDNRYDANGNPTRMVDALGNATELAYDTSGNLTRLADAAGNVTTYAFDSRGNQIRQTAPDGTVTQYAYDAAGNLLAETTIRTDADGLEHTLVTQHAYDANGNRIKTIDPLGNVTRTEYNAIGQVSAQVDALGRRTGYGYDSRGNRILTIHPDGATEHEEYDAKGNRVAETDRAGRTTRFQYDAAGRLIRTVAPDGTSTEQRYDPAGRLVADVDAEGNVTSYGYDAAGQRVRVTDPLGYRTEMSYDSAGQMVSQTDANGNSTRYEYDAAGRRIRTLFADDTETRTEYDALGRKVAQTDQNGHITRYGYDALGRLTSVTDALGQVTAYGYDEQGNKLTQTDAEGRTTRWTYDDLGRVLSRTLPLGQTETFAYDAVGNRVRHTDFNGSTTVFEYDELNRKIRRHHADGTQVMTTYTAGGQIATISDAQGTTTHAYDEADRLARIAYPGGQTIEYSYDARGNRVTLRSGGHSISYRYNDLSQLESVTDADGTTRYVYDPVGNQREVRYPNGTVTETRYDALNRPTQVTTRDASGAVAHEVAYTLDAAGHRTRLAETGRTVDYSYDALYRLTEEDIRAGGRSQTTTWTYDKVGNRLTQTRDREVTNYTYDENDRLLSEITLNEGKYYEYDANGNTVSKLSKGALTTYEYDGANRLVRVQGPGVSLAYTYDAQGIRQSKTENGDTTAFLVDPNQPYAQVLGEYAADGSERVFYTHGNDLLAQTRGGTRHYYHYDALGSTRALTDAAGALTDSYAYLAFGEVDQESGSTENLYLFTGEQYDPALQQYYLRARYMDPLVGRFNRMDTWAGNYYSPRTLNKFAYANSDPANGIDPSGYMTLASVSVGSALTISLRSVATASAGFAVASILYPSAENAVKTTMWDIIVANNIGHSIPREAYDAMAQAEARASDKTHKGPERHHTVPMYLCGHAGQRPLALITYAEHQIIHAGLSAVRIYTEAVGEKTADMLNIPLTRRRSTVVSALARNSFGRSAIANAIGAFYTVTGTGMFGQGAVNTAFRQVRGPFVGGYTSCN